MIKLLLLIVFCMSCAHIIESRTCHYRTTRLGMQTDLQSRGLYIVIVILLILFAGLRTRYNDTSTYILTFRYYLSGDIHLGMLLEPYGGFDLFQNLLKRYISSNAQIFIFLTSSITTILFVSFISRRASQFDESMLLFMTGEYIFSMAGIKQAIAMGIGLHAIDAYLNGEKKKFVVLLLIAMTFHPYVICMLSVLFLKDKVWNLKTIAFILIMVVAVFNMEKVFELLSLIGKDYSNDDFSSHTINPVRVLITAVPIAISLIFRKKINESNDEALYLGINMQIISFFFIFLGLFINPIYLGRMSTYFSVLSSVSIPKMLKVSFYDVKRGKDLTLMYYVLMFVYFLMDMIKLGSISPFYDQFAQTHISSLF